MKYPLNLTFNGKYPIPHLSVSLHARIDGLRTVCFHIK